MVQRTAIGWLTIGLLLAFNPLRAEDPRKPDSQWVGSIKVMRLDDKRKPTFLTADCRLSVLSREKESFKGELWWDNDQNGLEVEGIMDKGAVRFTPKRVLRQGGGLKKSDVIDNARFVGRLSDNKEIKGQFTVPGPEQRSGEFTLKLKE